MAMTKRARWMVGAAMVLVAGGAAAGPSLQIVVAPQTTPQKQVPPNARKAGHMVRPATMPPLDAVAVSALKKTLVTSFPKLPPSAQTQNLTAPLSVDATRPTAQVGTVWAGLAVAQADYSDWLRSEIATDGAISLKIQRLAQGALYLLDCAIEGQKSGGGGVPATANKVSLRAVNATGVTTSSSTSSVVIQSGHLIYGFMNPIENQDATWIDVEDLSGGNYYVFTGCTLHPS